MASLLLGGIRLVTGLERHVGQLEPRMLPTHASFSVPWELTLSCS